MQYNTVQYNVSVSAETVVSTPVENVLNVQINVVSVVSNKLCPKF